MKMTTCRYVIFLFSLVSIALVNGNEPASFCTLCVEFFKEALNPLTTTLNNDHTLTGCGSICSEFQDKSEQTVCSQLCTSAGFTSFTDTVKSADTDSTWACMEIGICGVSNNAAGNILTIKVDPPQGTAGTIFNITVLYEVKSMIPTGNIDLKVFTPSKQRFGDSTLITNRIPNQYKAEFLVDSSPSEAESFPSGDYTIEIELCNGSCGSSHSHSYVLDKEHSVFKITDL